jgi:hypothetical protein
MTASNALNISKSVIAGLREVSGTIEITGLGTTPTEVTEDTAVNGHIVGVPYLVAADTDVATVILTNGASDHAGFTVKFTKTSVLETVDTSCTYKVLVVPKM